MKTILILILIALPWTVSAACWVSETLIDSSNWDEYADSIVWHNPPALSLEDIADSIWAMVDTCYIQPKPHDITKEYIVEIKADTTWADKVQVWLTPEQLKELIQLLDQRMAPADEQMYYYQDNQRR